MALPVAARALANQDHPSHRINNEKHEIGILSGLTMGVLLLPSQPLSSRRRVSQEVCNAVVAPMDQRMVSLRL
jgi:hypothetical protein